MRKSIFNIAIILSMFSVVLSSCSKDDDSLPELDKFNASFTMTYDDVTYTKVEENSLILAGGNIGVAGADENPFTLIISGVGAEGTTTNIDGVSGSVLLDFGAAVGKEGFVASGGTIKRTGNKIEVNVSGVTTSLLSKNLTATIVARTVIGN